LVEPLLVELPVRAALPQAGALRVRAAPLGLLAAMKSAQLPKKMVFLLF
jgi:hypothetical protein